MAGFLCSPAAFPQTDIQATGKAPSERLVLVRVYGDRWLDDPGSVSVIDQAGISETLADHPAEILNTLPGVNIHLNSGQEHLIALRSPVLTGGAGQGSFLVLENGVPTRSPAFGNVNMLLEPHHEVADAIEVVRGPGSAKYGSNAVHGLINVFTRGVSDDGYARLSYGSLGRYRTDISAPTLDDSAQISLSLQKDTGWRDNTDINQQKLTVMGEYGLGDWNATPWIAITNLEQETAGFIEGENAFEDRDLAKSNPNPEAYRSAFSARAAVRLEKGDLVITPFLRTQSMQFAQHFLPNGGVEKNGHTGGGIQARHDLYRGDTIKVQIGGDVDLASGFLREEQLEPFGFFRGDTRFPQGVHFDYTVDTQVYALWSELNWSLTDRLSALVGIRGETHDYDYKTDAPVGIDGRFNVPEDRSDSFELFTPKLGLIWQGDEVSYFANYARGQRAPQASDLYRLQNLQVPGEIDEETLDSFEIGARGEAFRSSLVFDLAAYWATKESFFFRDSAGLNVVDGSTKHLGIEAAARYDFNANWFVEGQISWAEHTYTFDRAANGIVDGNSVDTAPEWLADLSIGWESDNGVQLLMSSEYIGEYAMDPAGSIFYDGHTLFNLTSHYPITPNLELNIIVRNLFDEAYADRADFAFGDERYFPGEPRNVTFSLTREF